jgi:hypothetical protein
VVTVCIVVEVLLEKPRGRWRWGGGGSAVGLGVTGPLLVDIRALLLLSWLSVAPSLILALRQ